MRKILTVIFLISFILALPSCNYIRQKLHFGKYSLEEALEWAKQDSLNVADSTKRVLAEKEVFKKTLTDSLMSIDNTNPPKGDKSARYHIITGSFANHDNALKEAGIYASKGFKPTIITLSINTKAGLELVSVKTFTDYNEAQTFLKEFNGSFDQGAWIYKGK
jgi:hypothetical protein